MEDSDKKKEEVDQHLGTVARESTLVIFGRFGGMGVGFVVNYVLAQYFGAEVLGRYSLVRTVLGIAVILTVAGLNQGLVKYIAQFNSAGDNRSLQTVCSTAFGYCTVFALFGTAVLVLSNPILVGYVFDDPGLRDAMLLGACLLVPMTAVRVFGGVYRGFQRNGRYTLARQVGLKSVLLGALVCALGVGWSSATGPVAAYGAGTVAVLLWYLRSTKKFGVEVWKGMFRNLWAAAEKVRTLRRELLGFSVTMSLVALTGFLTRKIDILMAGIFLESDRVGVYKIALTVSIFVGVFLKASNTIFSSIISELFGDEQMGVLEELYSSITKWILVLTLPVAISMWLYPEVILEFFGTEYVAGVVALKLLAAGSFAHASAGACGYILAMGEYERLQLVNNIVLAGSNVVLNLVLIPRYGITGAALATAISTVLVNLVVLAEVKVLLDLFPYRLRYLYVVAAAACMASLGWLLSPWVNNVVVVVTVTALNFVLGVGLMYLVRDETDRRLFERAGAKLRSAFES